MLQLWDDVDKSIKKNIDVLHQNNIYVMGNKYLFIK